MPVSLEWMLTYIRGKLYYTTRRCTDGEKIEEITYANARHSDGNVVVLSFDDTSAFGLPRFTKREIKNMTNVRVFELFPSTLQIMVFLRTFTFIP